MIRIASFTLVSLSLLAACGGSPTVPIVPEKEAAVPSAAAATAAPPAPSVVATSEPAPPAVKPAPNRALDAPKWLKDLQDEKEIDDAQRGKMAINGLSEEEFGLPSPLRRAMAAITSSSVDPSQSAAIIAAALSEAPMAELVAKQCGKPTADVMKAAKKAKPAEQAKLVVKLCKLDSMFPGAELAKLDFTAVLLSAFVQKLLEADPKHGEAEIGLARMAANFHRSDAK